ncbi:MAG: hypothetical protein Kow0068_14060 [Marinilabiliales bacterium]
MRNLLILILFITFSFLYNACNEDKVKLDDSYYPVLKKPLRGANRILVDKDSIKIAKYCKRMKWDCKVSPTGLFYEVYYHSEMDGDSVKPGDNVLITYKVTLLDGTICYTTDSTGPETFKLGYGVAEQGLEQGLLLMKEGDKAHLVLPPHLAYGLIGDEYKIPPRSIIVYDIELVKIFKQ